jgi:Ca2+-binding RTX toxin-like protein
LPRPRVRTTFLRPETGGTVTRRAGVRCPAAGLCPHDQTRSKTWTHVDDRRGRALLAGALSAACLTALFGVVAAPADAAYKTQVQSGTLQITGDAASDKLSLNLSPTDANTLVVDVGEDGTTDFAFDRSTFSAIDVEAGGGNDEVRIATQADLGNVTINGGAGDDTIIGGGEADVINGGPGDDTIDGGRGNDIVDMGAGKDRFLWDPGEGSDTVEGGGGNDVLEFHGSNAAEKIDVSANGSRVRLFRDVGAITMDLNGIEGLDLSTADSPDTVTIGDLTGTDLQKANIDLSSVRGTGEGDGAADTVIVDGTDGPDNVDASSSAGNVVVSGLSPVVSVSGTEPGLDNVDVNTLGGDDTITSGVGLSGPLAVNVDGGTGTDSATYSGTPGADTIGIARFSAAGGVATFAPGGTPLVTTGVESLDVRGLGGDDTITGQNGIAGLTALTIDGGAGDDNLTGGDGDDTLIGGGGNDVVSGARGADVALLGAGKDTFTWNPGDGSDTVEGQGGGDVVDFNGSNAAEKMDISANGSRVRLFRDVGAVTMDLNDVEALNVNTLDSPDAVTVGDLTGTGLKTMSVDLSANPGTGVGDGSADTVIENGTAGADRVQVVRAGQQVQTSGLAPRLTVAGSEPGLDTLEVNTLAGKDTVTVAPDVSTVINPVVDLGADQ